MNFKWSQVYTAGDVILHVNIEQNLGVWKGTAINSSTVAFKLNGTNQSTLTIQDLQLASGTSNTIVYPSAQTKFNEVEITFQYSAIFLREIQVRAIPDP